MIKKIKGTQDLIFNEIFQFKQLENKIKIFFENYNYQEIRTPIIEYSEVFYRSATNSDMVMKEIYNFMDKKGRSIALRPEGTAGIVRSYIENKLDLKNQLYKFYYLGPFFRYERPQKGRYRQFYQLGVEILGNFVPFLDLEVIVLVSEMLKFLGLENFKININTLGDDDSYQKYLQVFRNYMQQNVDELCYLCKERLINNILRIFDCKVCLNKPVLKNAPVILDYLNEFSKIRFNTIIEGLTVMRINFEICPRLVRGLDYYSHTVFEIILNSSSNQRMHSLGGGGCYTNLVENLGGNKQCGIGFAFGVERLILVLQQYGFLKNTIINNELDVYFLCLKSKFFYKSLLLTNQLRNIGIRTEINYHYLSFTKQLKKALQYYPKYLLILGDKENLHNQVILKNVSTQQQIVISQSDIVLYLKKEFNL